MDKLKGAVDWIRAYQEKNGQVKGWCWRRVRQGCQAVGLSVPSAGSAKEAYAALSVNPEAFGWKRATRDAQGNLPEVTLCFLKGKRPWEITLRRFGHAALLYKAVLYASNNYKMTKFWADRLIAAFVLRQGGET